MRPSTKTGVSLLVFAAAALLYPIGCGPQCSGTEFEYTEDDMRQHLEPMADVPQQYSATNDEGVVTLTLDLEQSSLSQSGLRHAGLEQDLILSVQSAQACSPKTFEQILVQGSVSATFKPDGGDEQVLFTDRPVDARYRVQGPDGIDNGTISVDRSDEQLSFVLESETGEIDAFELTSFWSQGNDSATVGPR